MKEAMATRLYWPMCPGRWTAGFRSGGGGASGPVKGALQAVQAGPLPGARWVG